MSGGDKHYGKEVKYDERKEGWELTDIVSQE